MASESSRGIGKRNANIPSEMLDNSDDEDSQDELSKEQVICRNGFSEHCYFQNKPYEIDQVEFFPIKSHNIFEILLSLTGGQIRRVSIIYPNQKATSTLNDDIDHGHHAN